MKRPDTSRGALRLLTRTEEGWREWAVLQEKRADDLMFQLFDAQQEVLLLRAELAEACLLRLAPSRRKLPTPVRLDQAMRRRA